MQHQKKHESVEVLKSGRSYLNKTQEQIWKEFNDHFKDPARERGAKINHHDFIDASFVNRVQTNGGFSRRQFFSNVGGRSLNGGILPQVDNSYGQGPSAVDLGRDRLLQTRKNYVSLQKNSYEIGLNKEKATIPKWLQNKIQMSGESQLRARVYDYESLRKTDPKGMRLAAEQASRPRPKKQTKPKEPAVSKNYDLRHIFVLQDDQDILGEDLKFTYVEINERLQKFVPANVWKSAAAQRLSLNQKIELSLPSQQMQEQCLLEILEQVSNNIGTQFETAWLIDGKQITSPLHLPIEARIMVVSRNEGFVGISGLEQFEGFNAGHNLNTVGGATFANKV